MEPQSGYIMQLKQTPTHQTTASVGNTSWIVRKVENMVLSMLCGVPTPLTKYVRCPHPILHVYDFPITQLLPPQKSMCRVPPLCKHFFCTVSPPQIYFSYLNTLALSWIMSKIENLAS